MLDNQSLLEVGVNEDVIVKCMELANGKHHTTHSSREYNKVGGFLQMNIFHSIVNNRAWDCPLTNDHNELFIQVTEPV